MHLGGSKHTWTWSKVTWCSQYSNGVGFFLYTRDYIQAFICYIWMCGIKISLQIESFVRLSRLIYYNSKLGLELSIACDFTHTSGFVGLPSSQDAPRKPWAICNLLYCSCFIKDYLRTPCMLSIEGYWPFSWMVIGMYVCFGDLFMVTVFPFWFLSSANSDFLITCLVSLVLRKYWFCLSLFIINSPALAPCLTPVIVTEAI